MTKKVANVIYIASFFKIVLPIMPSRSVPIEEPRNGAVTICSKLANA